MNFVAGQSDVTGPVADVNLMGYAMLLQIARGIHTRLYARAFIFADPAAPRRRFVYVVTDACMASQLVTMKVMQRLELLYGDLYSEANVALSGTHTHASPAGFLQYLLYSITSLGFIQQSFDALVDGIAEAIQRAHDSLSPAEVSLASGELLLANINRSPTAYAANPAEEQSLYKHDVDKTMQVLRIHAQEARAEAWAVHTEGHSRSSSQGPARDEGWMRSNAATSTGRGLISWFAVHCTSMNNTNPFVSGDNKGLAAQLLEKAWAQQDRHTSASARNGGFVAAFAQGSVGDSSPNVQGAFCLDTGEACEMHSSTCGGRNELCHGRGPAWPDDSASTAIIAQRQADKAAQLFLDPTGMMVSGPIDYRHIFINMSNTLVQPSPWTRGGRTCPAAMGFSFAAGTTDGPGMFDFTQGDTQGSPFWHLVRDLISAPSAEQQACQAPKPILLNTGYLKHPYPWQPDVTELSLLRLGSVVIVCVPGEFTTMAGRRIKAAVRDVIGNKFGVNLTVILSGLTGTYSSYVTTYEEYQVQRYEGASTLYGPHTLDAYIQAAVQLAKAMLSGQAVTSSVSPPNLEAQQISLLPPVLFDEVPAGTSFGDVVLQPLSTYVQGQAVEAVFRSGNPRNNVRRGGSFLAVQRLDGPIWTTIATDNDWSTHFYWERHFILSAQSFATVRWAIPNSSEVSGTYRLVHSGEHKQLLGGKIVTFSGITSNFTVMASSAHSNGGARKGAAAARSAAVDGCAQGNAVDPVAMLVAGEGRSTHCSWASSCRRALQHLHKWPWGRGWQLWWCQAVASNFVRFRSFCRAKFCGMQNVPLQARRAALASIHDSSVQYKAAFGCPWQDYVAWWRREGPCTGTAVKSEEIAKDCIYGPHHVVHHV
eukprot:gene10279-10438_t